MDRWENFRTLELGDWHNIERRIGVRVPTEGLVVTVAPSKDVIDLRDGVVGRVVEVSVTGAAIDASSSLPFEVSSETRIRYGEVDSTVTVRHVTETDEPGVNRYGIEWGRLEDPLRQVVYGAIADARTATA